MHPVGFDDGPEPVEQVAGKLLGPAERDARADTDTGQYYCVTEKGGFVSRDGRPIFATLAEWSDIGRAIEGWVYVPVTGGRRTTPLFGSVPLMNDGGAPDIVGDLVRTLAQLKSQAAEQAKGIALLDKIASKGAEGLENLSLLISQRIHFVELLDRAAGFIDPDSDAPASMRSYEARLDWLAKWREVVGR